MGSALTANGNETKGFSCVKYKQMKIIFGFKWLRSFSMQQ